MSKIDDFETAMAEIFGEIDAQEEYRQRLIDELKAENDILWSTIDQLRITINKV